MSRTTSSPALLALFSALIPFAASHSWVERACRIAPNGTMVGPEGFARGYVPRDSVNPPFSDTIPTNILPAAGQAAYSGNEILNKFPLDPNPAFPLLEASPGDHIAIMHLENGHTTQPQNQPNKPRNRGTIFFYGTDQPKDQERLFDVHLVWNRQGTGGDKRGRLLGTRNYDDGQCYQPSNSQLSAERASSLAPEGAKHEQELACQSDIKLPSDLKPGSIYTIYWYWDWPDLNPQEIDIENTKNGEFPWAGTFMRGKKDPNGFKESAIAKNESYSSVIDVKITKPDGDDGFLRAKSGLDGFIQNQDIYTKAIKAQMMSNFQVDVDVPGDAPGNIGMPEGGEEPASTTTMAIKPTQPVGGTVTVTQTVTVPPATVIKTVTITAGDAGATAAPALPSNVFVSSFLPGVPQGPSTLTTSSLPSMVPSSMVAPVPPPEETNAAPENGRPSVTPFLRARNNWALGGRW
ncbi:hypothetical protein LIA77_00878 [Sarocladium implicatum]|nr:hypothetical protein LIA77_00878 [Sarocladium implicatum]